jgi:chorismate mutase/prephenate dehydratase
VSESDDQTLRDLREKIADADRDLLDGLNRRLELVRQLWRHKAATGLPLLAPDREAQMTTYLVQSNKGPLSEEGLRAFYAELLALTKRELGG